jgi:hypothetical protein
MAMKMRSKAQYFVVKMRFKSFLKDLVSLGEFVIVLFIATK